MKENTASRLFFVFIAYFAIALLLGGMTAFVSYAASNAFSRLLYMIFKAKTAYNIEAILLPGFSFALACAILSIGQLYMTYFLNLVLRDKIMTFAAMCVACFFCSNAFLRYTGSTMFSMYPMRWLPCEIAAFIAGIAALRSSGPIFIEDEEYTSDKNEETHTSTNTVETNKSEN